MKLILIAMATWQIVEIVRHGSIADGLRGLMEVWESDDSAVRRFVSRLVICPFCLSVWAAGLCTVASYTGLLGETFLYAMAGSRAANFLNDIFHDITRTPKFTIEETHQG